VLRSNMRHDIQCDASVGSSQKSGEPNTEAMILDRARPRSTERSALPGQQHMGDDVLADASDLHSTRVLAKQEPDKEEANDVPRDRLAHLDHQTLLPGGRWSGRAPARIQPQDPSSLRATQNRAAFFSPLIPERPSPAHEREWAHRDHSLAAEVIATGAECLIQAR